MDREIVVPVLPQEEMRMLDSLGYHIPVIGRNEDGSAILKPYGLSEIAGLIPPEAVFMARKYYLSIDRFTPGVWTVSYTDEPEGETPFKYVQSPSLLDAMYKFLLTARVMHVI